MVSGFSTRSYPLKMKFFCCEYRTILSPSRIYLILPAITDKSDSSNLLNSSRHDPAPLRQNPTKNLFMTEISTFSEQLKTTHEFARDLF